MKTRILVSLLVALTGAAYLHAEETNKTIAVLFYGTSPVNSDTLHFLDRQAREAGYQLYPTQDLSKVQPGNFKAVILLNTGLEAGIDRRFAGFIDSWSAKQQLVLVTLKKGSTTPKVEVSPASPATLGVDAVSAASKLDGKGLFGPTELFKMHLEWTKQVLAYVGRLP